MSAASTRPAAPGTGAGRWPTSPASCLALLMLVASPAVLFADSFLPLVDYRTTDATHTYYVVVKRQPGPAQGGPWGPVELTIARRKPGSPPVQPDRGRVADVRAAEAGDNTAFGNSIAVRRGDVVHGRLALSTPPETVLVSATGHG